MASTSSGTVASPCEVLCLQAAVARYGEADGMGWWNSNLWQAGRGLRVLGRGLPRTAPVAQVGVCSAVASCRCGAVPLPPRAVTLWRLPPSVANEVDTERQRWLVDGVPEAVRGLELIEPQTTPLDQLMVGVGLVPEDLVARVRREAAPPGATTLELSAGSYPGADLYRALAVAFMHGRRRELVVPYALPVEGSQGA